MNDIMPKIKSMLLNRNSVTILGVVAGVIVLWFVYSATLSKAVDPIRVPVANKDLTSGTLITDKDVTYVEVNSDVLKKANVITSMAELKNKYVNNNTSIVTGEMFYKENVVETSKLVHRDFEKIPKGYNIYSLKVDNTSTYANSIYPGDKIDLWLKANIQSKIVYEEFLTSMEVLSVRDSSGNDVFDVDSGRTPAYIRFAVPEEYFVYLKRIEYLKDMQLYPVPKNKMYASSDAKPEFVNDELKTYIDSLVYQIPDSTTNNSNNNDNVEGTENNNSNNEANKEE